MAITRGTVSSNSRTASGTDASVQHTVDADTTLLVVSTMMEAGEDVSGTPQWSGNGTPQNLTLIQTTGDSGSNNDMSIWTYALEDPTPEVDGTVTVTHTSNDNFITVATNYLGTNASATMSENIALVSEDVNNAAGNSVSLASGGDAGNTLYAAGSFKGGDGDTVSGLTTNFVSTYDAASGTFANSDISGHVCDYIGGAASGCAWTWNASDENANHMFEIVVGVVGPVINTVTLTGDATAGIAVSDPTDRAERYRERIQNDALAADYSLETIRKRTVEILDSWIIINDQATATRTKAPQGGTFPEDLAATDAHTELRQRIRLLQDILAVVDSAIELRERTRLTTDALAATDSFASYQVCTRLLADALASTDASTELRERIRQLADTLEATDASIELRERNRQQAEAITAEDQALPTYVPDDSGSIFVVTLQDLDSVAATDSASHRRERNQRQADSIAATDLSDELRLLDRVNAESVNLEHGYDELRKSEITQTNASVVVTDDFTADKIAAGESVTYNRTLPDSLAATDNNVQLRERLRSLADNLSVADQALIPIITTALLDSIELSDVTLMERIRSRVLLDSFVVTDQAIAQQTGVRVRTLPDSLAVTDSHIELRERNNRLSDSAAITDASLFLRERFNTLLDTLDVIDQALIPSIVTVLIDALDATDSITQLRIRQRILTEAFVVIDNIVATSGGTSIRVLSDEFAVTDNHEELRLRFRERLDVLAATDQAIAEQAGTTTRVLSDEFDITDSHVELRTRLRENSDALAVIDATTHLSIKLRALSDALTTTDSLEALRQRIRRATDSAAITDAAFPSYVQGGIITRTRTLADTLAVTDSLSAEKVAGLTQFAIRHRIDQLDVDHEIIKLHILNKITPEE